MASLVEELIGVLKEEYDIYRQLIPVISEKTQIIVKNDMKSLQEITEKEQLSVDQVSALEHKRNDIMKDIQTVLGRKSEPLDLKTLIGLLDKQPDEQRALSVLHDNLKDVINQLIESNSRNQSLIQQSLEMIEFNMNFIQSTRMSPGNNSYTKGASPYDAQAFQTGMFDAKQ